MMDITFQLQIISLLVAVFVVVVGVLLPLLITVVGYVYIRRFEERIDNLSDQINQLWEQVDQFNEDTAQP